MSALDSPPTGSYETFRLVIRSVHNMSSNDLNATFAALADPTRRAILARLARGEATVLELAEPFDMSLPAVSKHLKVLERARLISRGRDAQRRPCRIEAAPLHEAVAYMERYRQLWEQSLDRLGDYLEQMKRKDKEKKKKEKKHARPT